MQEVIASKKLRFSILTLLILTSVYASLQPARADLPPPPPRGTFVGPQDPATTRSYTGGIIVVPVPQPDITQDRSTLLGKIECADEKRTVQIKEKSNWGLSIQGPISNAETQGIIDASKALRPDQTKTFPYDLQGSATEIRTWTHTKTIFEHIHYEIYAIRPIPAPQNELIGYLNVEKPKDITVKMDSAPCPMPATPKIDVTTPSFFDVFFEGLQGGMRWLLLDTPNNIGIFTFGTVKVYNGSDIVAATNVRSGENSTIRVPAGSYNVHAQIGILGIPFEWSLGQTEPNVSLIIVILTTIEYVIYIFDVFVIIITIFVSYRLFRWYRARTRKGLVEKPPAGPEPAGRPPVGQPPSPPPPPGT